MNDTLIALPNGDFRVLGQGVAGSSSPSEKGSARAVDEEGRSDPTRTSQYEGGRVGNDEREACCQANR